MANLAEEEAYIMFPGSEKTTGFYWSDRPKSYWAMHEYPTICRGTSVTKLYRVSASDKTKKEDLSEKMLAQRKAGKCPPIADLSGKTST